MIDADFAKLQVAGIDPKKLKEYQVLCLPENFESASNKSELYDAQETANLSKHFKAVGLKCANSFDLGIESNVLDRRGNDIWLGLIWILDTIAIPLVVGIISSLLAATITNMRQSKRQIHVSLHFSKGENVTKLKYDGDSQTLLQLLKEIDVEKNLKDTNSGN